VETGTLVWQRFGRHVVYGTTSSYIVQCAHGEVVSQISHWYSTVFLQIII